MAWQIPCIPDKIVRAEPFPATSFYMEVRTITTQSEQAAEFIGQLRTLRLKLGISQSALARSVGKTSGYICDLERGRRTPNLTTVLAIANGLDAEVFIQKKR